VGLAPRVGGVRGSATPATAKPHPADVKKLRAEVGKLEQQVAELESKQAELTAALEAPETYVHPGKAQHLNRELSVIVDQLTSATAAWEAAATRLTAMG